MSRPVASREIRGGAAEVKFTVDVETAGRIRDRVRTLLAPDPYASGPNADEYSTTTLYFDTDDFAVYSRRGSYRRAKYRIRRYGRGDVVFLERKLRTSDVLSKRRTTVLLDELPLLTADSPDSGWPGRWFHERLLMRKLGAVCQVAYRRTARVGMTDCGPIRVTLDDHLRAMSVDEPVFASPDGAPSPTNRTIVELKFRAEMPAMFKRLVEEFALEPARISKYRLGIEATRPDVVAATAARKQAAALERSRA